MYWSDIMRMKFSNSKFTKLCRGTATIIDIDESHKIYALTAAHNIISRDPLTFDNFIYADQIWFEIRQNKGSKGSKLIDEFSVSEYWIHPKYFEYDDTDSGYNIALIVIEDIDNILLNIKPIKM